MTLTCSSVGFSSPEAEKLTKVYEVIGDISIDAIYRFYIDVHRLYYPSHTIKLASAYLSRNTRKYLPSPPKKTSKNMLVFFDSTPALLMIVL